MFDCKPCKRSFKTERGLEEHIRQSGSHNRDGLEPAVDRYCDSCDILFATKANFEAHLRSKAHLEKKVPCVFGSPSCKPPCKRRFVSLAAMILHPDLKPTACIWLATTTTLNEFVCQNDTKGLFTTKGALKSQGKMYICRSSGCDGTFTKFSGLAQHLESNKCEHENEMLSEMDKMLSKFPRAQFEEV